MTILLPDAPWRARADLAALIDVLGGDEEARFVGGAVRDTLLGVAVKDVDVATRHQPDVVLDRLKRAGIRAVPTGIAHGTVTAVLDGWPVEVTTLRRDVATDGRRATVAFAQCWEEDAARRDFTMNALYAEAASGRVHDYFGGLADLADRRVRFIGDPRARILEDHLRILRHFRFFARFGGAEPDEEAMAACIDLAATQKSLSRERVADELLKLLGAADPCRAVDLMVAGGIFAAIVPEVGADGAARLRRLVAREALAGVEGAPLRRLAALLPPDARVGEAVASRLKLSIKARKRIATALSPAPDAPHARALAYRLGAEGAADLLLLRDDTDAREAGTIIDWMPPQLPIGGGVLVGMGVAKGPEVARTLRAVEDAWIAAGFPDAEATRELATQIVSTLPRASQ